jgi:hypothetical protein
MRQALITAFPQSYYPLQTLSKSPIKGMEIGLDLR